nr:macrophage mannose receptor 1-like [Procambarus clarkii]
MSAFSMTWGLAVLTLMCPHLQASGYESDQWPGVQLGAATTSGGCSVPFLPVGDQCLYFATFAELTYEEASQMCHSLDGELAAVLTATRLKNIIDYIYDNGLSGVSYWIDGTDRVTEGDFRTSSGVAVPMGTPFWTASTTIQQPADYQGYGGEDCMELYSPSSFYINDRNCSNLRAPLCEHSPQLLHTPTATPEELDCPPFFVSVGGLCLSFMTWAEETWADARQACHGLSGELAAITDIEQLRAVYLYLHQEGIAGHSFWLGGSDAATEGVWAWTDGHPVTMGSPFWGFVSSNVMEPDGGTAENCILLDAQGYHYFRDASCSLLMTPLCMTLL